MTIDTHVHELAVFWLSADEFTNRKAHDARVQSLAEDIQGAIETWQEDDDRKAADDHEQDLERRSLRGVDPQDIADKF